MIASGLIGAFLIAALVFLAVSLASAVIGILFAPRATRALDGFDAAVAERCGDEDLRNCDGYPTPSGVARPAAGRMYAGRRLHAFFGPARRSLNQGGRAL